MSEEKRAKKFSYSLLGWILLWTAFGVGLSLLFKFRGVSAPWANGFAPANFLIFITLIYYLTRERFKNFFARRKEQITRNIEEAKQAYEQALKTWEEGGTSPEKAAKLCLFLAKERPSCLSGRLIHVNEPYRDYVKEFEGKDIGDSGFLRRKEYRY